jgi:hypothetical protein
LAKPGRKSKLTPELQAKIVEALANGNTIENSCAMCGLGYRTIFRYLASGEASEASPYRQFWQDVKAAHGNLESWHVQNIRNHAEKQWTASAWYLERSNPDRWALKKPEAPAPEPIDNAPSVNLETLKAIVLAALEAHPEAKKEVIVALEASSR